MLETTSWVGVANALLVAGPAAWLVARSLGPFDGAALRIGLVIAMAAPSFESAPIASASSAWSALGRGAAIAVTLAAPIWVAQQVGATSDRLSGVAWAAESSPLARATACLAALVWLHDGLAVRGAALVAVALRSDAGESLSWAVASSIATVARALALGVALSIGPLLVALVVEVGIGAIARAGSPTVARAFAVVARPLSALLALGASLEVALHAASALAN